MSRRKGNEIRERVSSSFHNFFLQSRLPTIPRPTSALGVVCTFTFYVDVYLFSFYVNNDTEHIILQFFLSVNLLFEIKPHPYSYMCEYIYIYT